MVPDDIVQLAEEIARLTPEQRVRFASLLAGESFSGLSPVG
jgi:hypothetical protein